MGPNDLLRFAKAYRDLGHAVASQLDDLLADGNAAKCNENAVKLILKKLGRLDEEIRTTCETWLASHGHGIQVVCH